MTPEQFLSRIEKQPPAPVYLFLGQEAYYRDLCKAALLNRVLPGASRLDGLTQIDLDDISLSDVLDDARSMSLFTQERVIWVSGAENALPRRLVATEADNQELNENAAGGLNGYLKAPTPGTVLVIECSRYDWTGDDRARIERVERFFSVVSDRVEFRQLTPEAVRYLGQDLAKRNQLKLEGPELAALLDAVAGDAARLAAELEKLTLFVGSGNRVTMDDLRALVPNASQSTIFSLVNALGKRDRQSALRSVDLLVREGEYFPLALTFLGTQFRLALAAKEAGIRSPQQAQAFFSKLGVRMWRERSEQVLGTAEAFGKEQLSRALTLIYDTDRKFRDNYKDDRTVIESLVLSMTV